MHFWAEKVEQESLINRVCKGFKRWVVPSFEEVCIQWTTQLVSLIPIRWIVIYPLDSAIQCLNNWVLDYSSAEGADGAGGGGNQAQEHTT